MSARSVLLALVVVGCGSEASTPLPCDVDQVLADRCRLCHGDPTAFGAPMPLVSWEDIQAPAPTVPDRAVWEVMAVRVHDTARPMPPRGNGELTPGDLAILDDWFAADAPPGAGTCP